MGIIKYTTSLMMLLVFIITVTMFAINFAQNNNAAVSLANDSVATSLRDRMVGNATSMHEAVNESGTQFMESTIASGDEVTTSGKQAKVTARSSLGIITSALISGFSSIFGGDTSAGIVLTILLSGLAFVLFWYGYKAWVGRNPD